MQAVTRAIARDPSAGVEHRPDDRFLPVRLCDLKTRLAADCDHFGPDASALADVADAFEDVLCQEAQSFARRLLDAYATVNPDRDTQPPKHDGPADPAAAIEHAEQGVSYLFDKANFERLDDVQLAAVFEAANTLGVRVRIDESQVRRLSIWVRGRSTVTRTRRVWWRLYRPQRQTVEVFRRLGVVIELRDDPTLKLKLFKEIPVADVEALLPHARIAMSLLDRLKLIGGSAGALGSAAYKAISGAAALTSLAWAFLAGFATLAVRTFTGYRNTQLRRDSLRTQHLYFQNLANNAAVIYTLLTMIVQEETKEALLAYTFCHHNDPPAADRAGLDRRIETYIRDRFGANINFDAHDAFETLERLDLFDGRANLGVWRPTEAIHRLREHWHERRSRDYHASRCGLAAAISPPGAPDESAA